MDTVTIEVAEVLAETDLALLFRLDDDEAVWVPKSVITHADEIDVGDEDIEVEVKAWFAEREGMA
jgi:hypothetical protein